MRSPGRLRPALVALLVVSAVAFAIGTMLERAAVSGEAAVTQEITGETSGESAVSSSGETVAEHAAETGGEVAPKSGVPITEKSESFLGVDLESPLVIGLVVLLTAGLAIAAATIWTRPLLLAIVVFGAGAALLDIREIVHQMGEHRTGLVLAAAAVTALHVAVVALAGLALRPETAAE